MSHADLLASGDFVFDIDVRRGIIANENGGKARTDALGMKARNVLFEFRVNFVANFQAIQSLRGHGKRITRGMGELLRLEAKLLLPCAAMGGAPWRSLPGFHQVRHLRWEWPCTGFLDLFLACWWR